MTEATKSRLAAIGPYTAEPPNDGWQIQWDSLPALATDWFEFGLTFLIDRMDMEDGAEPDDRMFELWEAYRPHHPRVAEHLRQDAERRLELFGCPGQLREQVHNAEVTITAQDDDEYQVSIVVALSCNEHGPLYDWNPETGELTAQG